MIAADVAVVITSTLIPNATNWYGLSSNRVQLTINERKRQTIATIQSLITAGFIDIYLIDNSVNTIPLSFVTEVESLGVKLYSIPATNTATKNKGLSEIQLLLDFLSRTQIQSPILKISGRYQLYSTKLLQIDDFDIIGRVFHRRIGFSEFSTKAYLVKNSTLWELILKKSAKNVKFLIYKFWTPFLFYRMTNFLRKIVFERNYQLIRDPEISIEESFHHSFQSLGIKYKSIDELGVEGILAAEGRKIRE